MFKAFSHFTKILTVFLLGILLVQGVFGFNDIKVEAGDSPTNATDNISSLNNCSVYLSGVVLQFKPAEVAARTQDVGPCIDDAGKLYYDCTDSDLTHALPSNSTKASCKRASQAPATCYSFPNRAAGTGNRDITLKKTDECETALKETCSNQWNSGSTKIQEGCKVLYNNVQPIVAVTSSVGVTELTKCNTNFTPQDDTDLAKRNIKKGADGKYPQGTCKDDSGKLFICNQTPDSTGKYTNCVAANEEAKDGNKVVTPKSDDKSLGNGLIGIFLALLSIILLVIFYILNWALSFVLWVLGLIFVNILVINPVSVEYIEVAKAPWQILVNMANLLTLASLIFVGIGYILNIKSLKIGIQQLLLNVTIFSLLLNFTLLGLQGLTTITQGVGDAMITARSGQPPAFLSGGQNKLLDSVLIGIQGVSLVRCGNANLDGLAIKCQTGTTEAEKANATDTNFGGDFGNLTKAIGGDTLDITAGKIGDKTLRAMLLEVVYTMVLLYTITVMFKGAMMVLVRLVAFWLLLIVSPLALASYFMPVPSIKKYAGQWAEKTWQLAIFYPVAILLLILISEIVSQFAGAINKSIGGAATTATGNAAYLDTVRVYALTGDFGSVFTALLGSILIGVVAAAAFGAMSTFMDKFLGPIAKALGDGIKSAASALGTAGYIGGGAIRMGAGLANKATSGLTKNMLNRSPLARGIAKFLPKNTQANADKRKAMLDSAQRNLLKLKKSNLIASQTGGVQRDLTDAEARVTRQKSAYNKAKMLNNTFGRASRGVNKVANSRFSKFAGKTIQKGGKIGGQLGNGLLDVMQYGVQDLTTLYEVAKESTWDAAGKSRKANEADRKAQQKTKFAGWLVNRKSAIADGVLANSTLGNNLDYVPGVGDQLTKEEIDTAAKNSGSDARSKIQETNKQYKTKQIKDYVNQLEGKTYNELSNVQKNVVRDMMKRIADDEGIAISVSNDENTRDWFAKNIHDVTDADTMNKIIKTRASILQRADGKMGTGKPAYQSLDDKLEESVKNRALALASMTPEARKLEGVNNTLMAGNDTIVDSVRSSGSDYYADLVTAGGRNRAVNGTGATSKYNAMRDSFKPITDANGQVSFENYGQRYTGGVDGEHIALMKALLSTTNSRIHELPAGQRALQKALEKPDIDKAGRDQAWDKFYQGEFGLGEYEKDLSEQKTAINGMSLKQLENTNQSRKFIQEYGDGWENLSPEKQLGALRANSVLGLDQFNQNKSTYKEEIESKATDVAKVVKMSAPMDQSLSGMSKEVKAKKAVVQTKEGAKSYYETQAKAVQDLQASLELQSKYQNSSEFQAVITEAEAQAQQYVQGLIPKLQQEKSNLELQLQTVEGQRQQKLQELSQTDSGQLDQMRAAVSQATNNVASSDQGLQNLSTEIQSLQQRLTNAQSSSEGVSAADVNTLQFKSNQLTNAKLILDENRARLATQQLQLTQLESNFQSKQNTIESEYQTKVSGIGGYIEQANQGLAKFEKPEAAKVFLKEQMLTTDAVAPELSAVSSLRQNLSSGAMGVLAQADSTQEMINLRTSPKIDEFNKDLGGGVTIGDNARTKYYTKLNSELAKVGMQGYIKIGDKKFDFSDPSATPERVQEMQSTMSELAELSRTGELTNVELGELGKRDCFNVPEMKNFKDYMFTIDTATGKQIGAVAEDKIYQATLRQLQAETGIVQGSSDKSEVVAARISDSDMTNLDQMRDKTPSNFVASKLAGDMDQRARDLLRELTP